MERFSVLRILGKLALDVISAAAGQTAPPQPTPAPERRAERTGADDFLRSVKLVHSDVLKSWSTFARWQDHEGFSCYDYLQGARRLRQLEDELLSISNAESRLQLLDREHLVEYRVHQIDLQGSPLGKLAGAMPRRIAIPPREHLNTVIETTAGRVDGNTILVDVGWFRQTVSLRYRCPSRVLHEKEILNLRSKLETLRDEGSRAPEAEELRRQRYGDPLLFVSHRWTGVDHPDAEGTTLQHLRDLAGCWLIIDFCSFPQRPRTVQEEAIFQEIMRNMSTLVRNTIILNAADYLSRGWCVYEYIVASLHHSVVCDEVRHAHFHDLINWTSTEVIGDVVKYLTTWGLKSALADQAGRDNYKNERIIEAVNRIVPLFKEARFTEPEDREIVAGLLLAELKAVLPWRSKYEPYISEWQPIRSTDDELLGAFEKSLEGGSPTISFRIEPNRPEIPGTVREASERRYSTRSRATASPATLGLG